MPHPDNCAQYIDCRQKNTPLGNYRQECPYPQLVSLGDATGLPCKTFQSVQCGARPEPKNACKLELLPGMLYCYKSVYKHEILTNAGTIFEENLF